MAEVETDKGGRIMIGQSVRLDLGQERGAPDRAARWCTYFGTKNPSFGIVWRALEWKKLLFWRALEWRMLVFLRSFGNFGVIYYTSPPPFW
jgi:hypothetical protein